MRQLLGRLLRQLGDRPRRRPNLLVGAYRWRWELLTLGGFGWLGAETHWAVPLVAVLLLSIPLLAWPRTREYLVALGWSVFIQHRLRTAFSELGLSTWAGRPPMIIWSSPRPRMVRVLVAAPPGTDVTDFAGVRGALGAACCVDRVEVDRHRRFSNVIVLYVVIRPDEVRPLGRRVRRV